jgi:hypothetical protein
LDVKLEASRELLDRTDFKLLSMSTTRSTAFLGAVALINALKKQSRAEAKIEMDRQAI